MGWLRSVGSIKLYVSFAEYRLFYRTLLQKRPVIVSILLTEATPHPKSLRNRHRQIYDIQIHIYIYTDIYLQYRYVSIFIYSNYIDTHIYIYVYVYTHTFIHICTYSHVCMLTYGVASVSRID